MAGYDKTSGAEASPLTREDLEDSFQWLHERAGRLDYSHYPSTSAHHIQSLIAMDLVSIHGILGLDNEWELSAVCTFLNCCYGPHVHAYNPSTQEEKVYAFLEPR